MDGRLRGRPGAAGDNLHGTTYATLAFSGPEVALVFALGALGALGALAAVVVSLALAVKRQ